MQFLYNSGMEFLLTNNVPIFICVAGGQIVVGIMILSTIIMRHLWEGLMPYSLLCSILLGVIVIISHFGVLESYFIIDDSITAGLILLQLTLCVLYPINIIKKNEAEPFSV